MPLKTSACSAYRVELYVPSSCKGLQTLQEDLAVLAGGCTATTAYGQWKSPRGMLIGEPCMVVQALVSGWSKSGLVKWVAQVGEWFMNENPQEEMFLGYAAGQKIIIERT